MTVKNIDAGREQQFMKDKRAKDEADRDGVPAPSLPVVASEALFGGARQIVIDHHGDRYVLRITRQNKLILNK